ncbi:taurine dioxygenase [Parvibaculum indicum]|uniref:TauD/TfdA dioxygenase family protein n=1 Tax=Parvibaculum indicum TaxID=562969 RepID=UPI0014217255|nr:TauD/TfdA family dioxygenase [Parvibaculum indicum]NIJ42971.1 taurine dioxygenase [Parvibaculum indicum]
MDYEILEIKPMTANIGAEVFGVDLSEPLTDALTAELRQAITDYQVIFFRDQHIDHDQHKALGKAFGELAIHSGVAGLAEHPEIVAIHADANSKFIAGDNWHSDLTCNDIPPMGSILYLHTVPEVGGDTLFASMYAAYDALSDRMKAYLEGLYAVHDGEHVYRPITNDPDKKFPCNEHPVVRTHPVSGKKGIFVNPSYTTKIVGMRKDESDGILQMLYKHCANPNFQVRFRWQPNSIAFWDNRCTWHLAVWDYFPQTRSGFRVTVAEDKRPA